MHLLEIAGRVVVVYVALLIMLRLAGRREMTQLTPIDLLTILLISETVSPALTGDDSSLGTGLFAAAVLLVAAVGVSWLTFRHRRLDRALEGKALVLVDRGKLRGEVMREQRITDQQLRTALHEHGLLHVDQVAKAFVEPDGNITIIKKDDLPRRDDGRTERAG